MLWPTFNVYCSFLLRKIVRANILNFKRTRWKPRQNHLPKDTRLDSDRSKCFFHSTNLLGPTWGPQWTLSQWRPYLPHLPLCKLIQGPSGNFLSFTFLCNICTTLCGQNIQIHVPESQTASPSAKAGPASIRIYFSYFSIFNYKRCPYFVWWWFSHSVVSNSLQLMDCSLPGSSVHGISQARILQSVDISSSKGSSRPRDWTQDFCNAGRFSTDWATREVLCLRSPISQ